MTLVIGALSKNFAVAGVDSRGTIGDIKGPLVIGMDRMKKLTQITDHVTIMLYGISEFGENLIEEFKKEKKSDLDGVTNVVEEFRIFCQKRWSELFKDVPSKERPFVGFMLVGLDQKREGEDYDLPRIYSMESPYGFAFALHKYGFATRGVYSLATYILNKRYRENMSVNDLCTLVAYAISETASIDKRVGGPIRIAVIDPEGSREISSSDIESMLESYSTER